MPPADDAGQRLPGQGIRAVKAGDLPGQGGHEGLRHPLRHPDVVRGHAGLPRVEELAPGNAGRGQLHIGVGAKITGDLPPSSRVAGVRCSAAAAMTFFPTAGLPVKKIPSKGLSTRASASSRPPRPR